MDLEHVKLITEIHTTVRNIDERFKEERQVNAETRRRVEKLEKRQLALFAWFTGVGTAVGGSVTAFFHKIMGI